MRRLLSGFFVLGAFISLVPLGCGQPSATCKEYCELRSKCCAAGPDCPDKADIPTCISTCEDLSADPAFAKAMQDQAGCFESTSCQDIQSGKCNPSP